MEQHRARVKKVRQKVIHFHDEDIPFRMWHGSTYSTRPSTRRSSAVVDVTFLNHIIDLDCEAKIVTVEPNVPMDMLVDFTLQQQLVPPVVLSTPGITVGGAFVGIGGDTSSFRFGSFDRIVTDCEVILANGDLVVSSDTPRQGRNLIDDMAISHGTLGVVTMLKISLVNAKPFVRIDYQPVTNIDKMLSGLWQEQHRMDLNFLEGLMFGPSSGVIISSRMYDPSQEREAPTIAKQGFTKATDPYFYMHAREVVSTGKPSSQLTPLKDYLFRYDRGGFWMGEEAFKYFNVPFNRFTRWLLDWYMHSRTIAHAYHRTGDFGLKYICKDFLLPNASEESDPEQYKEAKAFFDFLNQEWGHYPILLAPGLTTIKTLHGLLLPRSWTNRAKEANIRDDLTVVSVGVYGLGPPRRSEFIKLAQAMEQEADELLGFEWTYAIQFRDQTRFWNVFDKERYDSIRDAWGASKLTNIFTKLSHDWDAQSRVASLPQRLMAMFWGAWKFSALYAVASATLGGLYQKDYLLDK